MLSLLTRKDFILLFFSKLFTQFEEIKIINLMIGFLFSHLLLFPLHLLYGGNANHLKRLPVKDIFRKHWYFDYSRLRLSLSGNIERLEYRSILSPTTSAPSHSGCNQKEEVRRSIAAVGCCQKRTDIFLVARGSHMSLGEIQKVTDQNSQESSRLIWSNLTLTLTQIASLP